MVKTTQKSDLLLSAILRVIVYFKRINSRFSLQTDRSSVLNLRRNSQFKNNFVIERTRKFSSHKFLCRVFISIFFLILKPVPNSSDYKNQSSYPMYIVSKDIEERGLIAEIQTVTVNEIGSDKRCLVYPQKCYAFIKSQVKL